MVHPIDPEFGKCDDNIKDKITNGFGDKIRLSTCEPAKGVDFETALAATGYGKFNILLLFCLFPAYISTVSVSSSISYTFTKAKCDLDLNLVDMGTINAMTYTGMIISSMLWGFLSDTLGRKKILMWGYLSAGFFDALGGLSQNYTMLLITRFCAGFIINGPFIVSLSYIAELHRADLRARVMFYTSCFYTVANTGMPLVAWLIIPQTWHLEFFNGFIVLHSWNIYLITLALMPLTAGCAFSFVPESPKFLLSRGRNDEALKVLQKLFAMNTGKDPKEFPVAYLIAEKKGESARGFKALLHGFSQLAPLFKKPYCCYLILLCFINLTDMLGHNTIRLWFPQLAAMLEVGQGNGLCSAIMQNETAPVASVSDIVDECSTLDPGASTYLQSAGVGSTSAVAYIIGGMLINALGKRRLVILCLALCAIFVTSLPLLGSGSAAEAATVILVALVISLSSLANVAISSISVDMFPTSLRVTAMAMFFMFGRLGTITGNVAFPALLQFGCLAPFLGIGLIFAAGSLGCILIPKQNDSAVAEKL